MALNAFAMNLTAIKMETDNLDTIYKSGAGYLHAGYAESLAEFGMPRKLAHCGGWILQRQIFDWPEYDAMGCYPLFCCWDWSQLSKDLAELQQDVVTLTLVTDPFGDFNLSDLQHSFDLVKPFKQHFIADLSRPIDEIVSKHHRYYARKALKQIRIEISHNAMEWLDDWLILYGALIERHNITGIRAFSREAFAKQLSIPGMVMFRAVSGGNILGANLFYVHKDIAYTHLSAFSTRGYALRASYAVRWTAIEYFIGRARWLNLGAGSGINKKSTDGLSKFKEGWSTETRTAYICGRIFDHEKYTEIVKAKDVFTTDYFPAYREGEFN